jgi:hypothetical protein
LDHKLHAAGCADPAGSGNVNLLNTWHSFGRPEIISLQEQMARTTVEDNAVLLLPCSRRRPYSESRTHTRLLRQLADAGYNPLEIPHVVVTALGVVPKEYWGRAQVMTYDAGAVDLWRIFMLLRGFLAVNRFAVVVDCLSFKPYSDMLDVLCRMGVISKPIRPLKIRWRGFHVSFG